MKIMTAIGMKLVDGQQYGEVLPPSGSLVSLYKTKPGMARYLSFRRKG